MLRTGNLVMLPPKNKHLISPLGTFRKVVKNIYYPVVVLARLPKKSVITVFGPRKVPLVDNRLLPKKILARAPKKSILIVPFKWPRTTNSASGGSHFSWS